MKALLNCAVNTLTDGQYSHIGSECLWNKHRATVSKTVAKLEKYQLKQVPGNNRHPHIITIFTELYTVEAEIFVED